MIDLSIVIPLRNEQQRLAACLEYAQQVLNSYQAEIILVVNGCTDQTERLVADYVLDHRPQFRWLKSEPGKGAAVRAGALAADGDYVLITDCDWSVRPLHVWDAWQARKRASVVIADREHRLSVRVGEPARRHISGRLFNLLTRAALPELRGISDTQCGFKLFDRWSAQQIFSRCQVDGWAWDIEVLYLARRMVISIERIPVTWHYDGDSRVRLVQDALGMAREVAKIRKIARQVRGVQLSDEHNTKIIDA